MAAQNLAYRKLSRVFFFLALVFAVFWMVLTSIRPDNDIHKFPPTVIPKALTLSNYLYVFTGMKGFSRTFLNSVVVTVSTVLIVLTIPTIITFVFAWQEFMFASTINKKNN